MLTYKVYFRIALFPEGVKGFHFEEEEGDNGVTYGEFIEDTEVFDEYLCTDHQAPFVVNELSYIYSSLSGDTVTELQYEDNGKFNCKITLQSDEWLKDDTGNELESYINELLWPADIHDSAFMFIKEKPCCLQLEIDYITDWLEEDDDESPPSEDEEDEEEDEEEDQHMFNGVYYADAMEMEAAIEFHFKWRKQREQTQREIDTDTQSKMENQPEKIEFI